MKRYVAMALLGGASSLVCAQGYVGAVLALTNIGADCPAGLDCKNSSEGFRLYAGTKLPPRYAFDFGFGKLDALEVGYMRFGRGSINGTQTVTEYIPALDDGVNNPIVARSAPLNGTTQADAITAAVVAHVPIAEQFAASARLGLAYVSSTYRTVLDGRSYTSETATKLKPYIGFGLEYDIPAIAKIIGTFDMTKYDAAGLTGNLRMIGLGAERSF